MRRETVKTIIIVVLSVIFVAHSIEKKSVIDEIQAEKDKLQNLIGVGNKSMIVASSLIMELETSLARCRE